MNRENDHQRAEFSSQLLAPKYWPTWLGLACVYVVVNVLPHNALMAIGSGLGVLSQKFVKRRRQVVEKNLALCYPDFSIDERANFKKEVFKASGRGIIQGFCAWFWPAQRLTRLFKHRCKIEGLEHFNELGDDHPTILLSGHFTSMEITAAFVGQLQSVDGFYKRDRNALYEFIQRKGRERHHHDSVALKRDDLKTVVRRVKSGRKICYFPDQDMRQDSSVFVDFMGQPAATVTATATLARLTKATVLPYAGRYDEKTETYVLRFFPKLENFPSGKDAEAAVADAQAVNHAIEEMVRFAPSQYFWVHRRFKTRENGEKDFYKLGKEFD